MSLPVPDYPVDFPTDSALFIAKFTVARFPEADRATAFDQAFVVLSYGLGKIKNQVAHPTFGAGVAMSPDDMELAANEVIATYGEGFAAPAIGIAGILSLIKLAWNVIKIIKGL